jgi:hypothetical protein
LSRRSRRGVAFVLISKLYRQMYANTGIATDSARVARSTRWANLLGRGCRLLFPGAADAAELAMPEAPRIRHARSAADFRCDDEAAAVRVVRVTARAYH